MGANKEGERTTMTGGATDGTTVERRSARELVVTRMFNAPVRLVFKAWATPELFLQWWVLKSSGATLLSSEMDIRAGGGYRLEFGHPAFDQPMVFFGKYLEVAQNARLVWTNEESPDGAVTTVTFTEDGDKTRVVLTELYPTKEALDTAIETMDGAAAAQFAQLDELLAAMAQ